MDELKCCPFCGGEARMHELYDHTWEIYCIKCYALIGDLSTREEAIEAWNRRCDDE